MFGIHLTATLTTVNDWGKHYWGLLLVVYVGGYFLSNFVHNLGAAIREERERRLSNAQQFTKVSTLYPMSPMRIFNRRQPGGMLKRFSDSELGKGL